jgi:hypothetical protein
VGLQKELQSPACDHAPIGLESRLHLQPVEIAIKTRNRTTGKRTLTIVDGSPFGRPLGFMGVLVCASRFLPSAWRCTVAMMGSSTDLKVELSPDNVLQKILLEGKISTELPCKILLRP